MTEIEWLQEKLAEAIRVMETLGNEHTDCVAEIERLRRLYPGEEIARLREELATTELAFQQAVKDCHMGAAEIERLHKLLDETVRERETYNGYHQAAVMEIDRLRDALLAIACDPTGMSSTQADIAKRALEKTNV